MPKTNQRYLLTKFNWQLDDSYLSITLLQIKKEKKKNRAVSSGSIVQFQETNSTNDRKAGEIQFRTRASRRELLSVISTKVLVANSEWRVTLSSCRRQDRMQHPTLLFLATSLSLLSIPEEDKRSTSLRNVVASLRYIILQKFCAPLLFLLLTTTAGVIDLL
ncbi:hypothetical protein CAJAP_04604 [Camponotus japonicus]